MFSIKDEIKPCPFCGCKEITRCVDGGCLPSFIDPETQKQIIEETPYYVTCSAECNNCGARIEAYAKGVSIHDLYTKAIENCYRKWNRRIRK